MEKESAKLKKRKKCVLKDLGEKVEVKPSFFASIAPGNNLTFNKVSRGTNCSQLEDESISNGTFSPCLSHTDSEVIRCNHRLLVPTKSEVRRKV